MTTWTKATGFEKRFITEMPFIRAQGKAFCEEVNEKKERYDATKDNPQKFVDEFISNFIPEYTKFWLYSKELGATASISSGSHEKKIKIALQKALLGRAILIFTALEVPVEQCVPLFPSLSSTGQL